MSREKYCGKQLYPHLFAPIRIGNLRLKNRIIAAPTSPSMITTDGHFTPEMNAYLEEKALVVQRLLPMERRSHTPGQVNLTINNYSWIPLV